MYRFGFITTLLLLLLANSIYAQIMLLYGEDFENFPYAVIENDTGGPIGNFGNNMWIVNNEFDGMGIYPNTISQDSTVGGVIGLAPNSHYLHIHDSTAAAGSGVANANFNNQTPSDRFVPLANGFCTLGLVDVKFTFFYLCEGSTNSYGEVYYSIDGGSWIQTGQAKYNNNSKWVYEIVQNPAFENVLDLRFGFRWVNGTDTVQNASFSIDDIIAVGTYDPINFPVSINITQVMPDPICQLNNLIIFYELSGALCAGIYEVQLSTPGGFFFNPTSLGVFSIGSGVTVGGVAATIPGNTNPNNCYKVRINRLSPPPVITGFASVCFEVTDCPNIITTLQPPVTFGPDTLCVQSAIDIPFYSTGVYDPGNIYTAELSDSNGSFANPQVIGVLPSNETFDPALGSFPGQVSGLVPVVPEACGYYIRVTASNPLVVPDSIIYWFGPFCIRECDILTNQTIDIQVCISDTAGEDVQISIDINTWDSLAQYFTGNQFQVQVINSMFYFVINTGGLGATFDTTSTTMIVSIPPLPQLIAIVGAPGYGMYYMRIVGTNSSQPHDLLGSLIRLTIGAPATIPSIIIPDTNIICQGQVIGFLIEPYNSDSQYEWISNGINGGNPFFWDFNPLLVNFTGAAPGVYTFFVREHNFGCVGAWSPETEVYVIQPPLVNISGPDPICQGDTVTYTVPDVLLTYYEWSVSFGTIIDSADNEMTVVFDSAGFPSIGLYALNACGPRFGNLNIEVIPLPELTIPNDTTICPNELVILTAEFAGGDFTWSWDDSTSTEETIFVVPGQTTTIYADLIVPNACPNHDSVVINIIPPPPANAGPDTTVCEGNSTVLIASGGDVYRWVDDPSLSQHTVPFPIASPSATTTYYLAVTDFPSGCKGYDTVTVFVEEQIQPDQNVLDTICIGGEQVLIATDSSLNYIWTTGDTTKEITVDESGIFAVRIFDGTDLCGYKQIFNIVEEKCPASIIAPSAFTPNNDGANDFFTVFGVEIVRYEIHIFNRWGEEVYFSDDLSEVSNGETTKGWDGNYKGEPQDMGSYVFYIVATALDGEKIQQKGSLTLIR